MNVPGQNRQTDPLWLHGSTEDRDPLWCRYHENMATKKKQLGVIEDADHSYRGLERVVFRVMSEFLRKYILTN